MTEDQISFAGGSGIFRRRGIFSTYDTHCRAASYETLTYYCKNERYGKSAILVCANFCASAVYLNKAVHGPGIYNPAVRCIRNVSFSFIKSINGTKKYNKMKINLIK